MILGIDVGSWFTTVIALSGTASAEVAGGVPLLDPGPISSVAALMLAGGLMWHQRRRSQSAR